MSAATIHHTADATGVKPDTVLAKALAFFDRNPDEILTRDDICVKWDCCPRTAKTVAQALIREGVPRAQLPRPARRSRAKRPATFPESLTPSEVRAIYAIHRYGTVDAAAAAMEVTSNTIASQLRDARRKAGVHKTTLLVDKFLADEAAEGGE